MCHCKYWQCKQSPLFCPSKDRQPIQPLPLWKHSVHHVYCADNHLPHNATVANKKLKKKKNRSEGSITVLHTLMASWCVCVCVCAHFYLSRSNLRCEHAWKWKVRLLCWFCSERVNVCAARLDPCSWYILDFSLLLSLQNNALCQRATTPWLQ